MNHSILRRCRVFETAVLLAGLLAWPVTGAAQEVSGQASAVRATVLGTTTVLSDTGTLNGPDDAREASSLTGSIPMLGAAEVLHATTVSSVYGWDSLDSVASEAALANLNLNVPGNTVAAGFVMARALAPVGGSSTGTSSIDGLLINGLPVAVTGAPNQTVGLLGGRVVINEQQSSATGTAVNALHVIVDGVADVVIASASAGITPESSTTSSTTTSTLSDTTSTLSGTTSTLGF